MRIISAQQILMIVKAARGVDDAAITMTRHFMNAPRNGALSSAHSLIHSFHALPRNEVLEMLCKMISACIDLLHIFRCFFFHIYIYYVVLCTIVCICILYLPLKLK